MPSGDVLVLSQRHESRLLLYLRCSMNNCCCNCPPPLQHIDHLERERAFFKVWPDCWQLRPPQLQGVG